MMAQHVGNLEERILQYQHSVNDTVNDTVKPEDTVSRLLDIIRRHPDFTYDQYAETLGVGRATVARLIRKLKGNAIHRIGSDKNGYWSLTGEKKQ